MRTASDISFRKLTKEDFSLLHEWLNADPVLEWYAQRPMTLDDVVAKYLPRIEGREPTDVYVTLIDGQDAGLIQTYLVDSFPTYAAEIAADGAWAGVDFFIGERKFRGRGLASMIISTFVDNTVFGSAVDACVSGPRPDNVRSIRALERAGFSFLKTVVVEGEAEHLMIKYSGS